MIEDSNYIPDDYGDNMEVFLELATEHRSTTPRYSQLRSASTPRVSGSLHRATIETTPFHLARLI